MIGFFCFKIEQTSSQSATLSRLLENSMKPVGEEYVETIFDGTNKPLLYQCKLCECKFNDINGKDMHLKGKRHRLSYKVNKKEKTLRIFIYFYFIEKSKSKFYR